MSRHTSNVAIAFNLALTAYKTTSCDQELWFVKKYAAVLISGEY